MLLYIGKLFLYKNLILIYNIYVGNSIKCKDVYIADIGYKNKLKSHNIYFTLFNIIVDLVTAITEFNNLRCETELVRRVCNIIENSLTLSKNSDGFKINKKQLALDALQRCFNYNEQEKHIVSAMIDFLISNNFVKK